jgi:hypothetical protein
VDDCRVLKVDDGHPTVCSNKVVAKIHTAVDNSTIMKCLKSSGTAKF